MADGSSTVHARALLQQCLHAHLQVRPADGDAAAQWVEVMPGLPLTVVLVFLSALVGERVSLSVCSP